MKKKLNEAGIFDEELNDLDEDTIDTLNQSVNTQVFISYTSVDDETGECTKMNDETIDEIIDEQIDTNKIDYEENDSVLETIEKSIGIKVMKAKAKELKDEKVSTSGAMKQIIYACQYKKDGVIHVIGTAKWLKEANYRNKDVFGVCLSGASIKRNTLECKHSVDHIKKTKVHESTSPSGYIIGGSGDGVAYAIDLFGDRMSMTDSEKYENETIQIKFQCNALNKKSVRLATHYLHLQSEVSYSPNISVSASGISVGVGMNINDAYHEINRNAYIDYKPL